MSPLTAVGIRGSLVNCSRSRATHVCADLTCSLFVRGLKPLDLPQGTPADVEERVARLRRRLDGFVSRVLGR